MHLARVVQLGLYFLFYRVISVSNTRHILGQELGEGSPKRAWQFALDQLPWLTVESAAAELMESGICATYSRVGAEFGLPRFGYTMLLSQEKLDSALRT